MSYYPQVSFNLFSLKILFSSEISFLNPTLGNSEESCKIETIIYQRWLASSFTIFILSLLCQIIGGSESRVSNYSCDRMMDRSQWTWWQECPVCDKFTTSQPAPGWDGPGLVSWRHHLCLICHHQLWTHQKHHETITLWRQVPKLEISVGNCYA